MQITDDAIAAAVELSNRYITGRCLPDKAIDVIDESGARVRLKSMSKPPNLKEIDEEVEQLNREKEEAVANQDFEKAASACAIGPTSSRKRRTTSPASGARRRARTAAWSTRKSSPRSSPR